MDEQYDFRAQKILGIVLFSIVIITGVYINDRYLRNTTVVFCDVGQGDAAYIRTKSGIDILIDFGPDNKILNCLGKYMPFYDNEVDLAFVSHFDQDHYGGLSYLSSKYTVKQLIYPECLDEKCRILLNSIKAKKIPYSNVGTIKSSDFMVIPLKIASEGLVEGKNESSEVFKLEMGNMSILFTGDANLAINSRASDESDYQSDVLKLPHHGSRYNLNSNFLELADASLSVISVGKNNQYGHPHKEVVSLLKALKEKYIRTDVEGDVVIELLQEYFQVKTQKSGEKYRFKYR